MTTVTSPKTLGRSESVRRVSAYLRGVSVEPLFENISLPLEGIDWVIIGGESGTGAGKFHLEWARTIQKQTKAAEAAFFMKQLGAHATFKGNEIVLSDSHGGDWDEWPKDLRCRQFPRKFLTL